MRGTLKVFIGLLLPIMVLAVGAPGSARAQQQEKRIALVVGNGAYAKSPLATTANDAGLIAQTLQAAGFDVVGARDLDGDTMRKSFRDFIQKAQASGPGTVAMVYLAGYGVQLAGENYFIPVDSNITRDTDVPTEGLRVSDYLRQLAAIPLKANIVVLDAARAQPFIEGGQPIASGLALVEPDPNMLIAFNAAPGTVAPEEPGPYGIYAQSLAEMIRTGGLPIAEVFERVRLRVNEASKGAQVPWNEQKISAPFSFFERGPDAPPQTAPDQVAATRNKPIRDLGAQDAYAAVLERDTLPAYEEFLSAYPNDPMAKRVMAIVAARREAITWRRTYRTDTPEAYWSYLRRYPRGPHAGDARRRLAILTAPVEPPPTFAMIDYDVPPPPPEEIVYIDRPVLLFGDPVFGFAPPPPPPVYYLPPPPPDFVVLEPPLPVVGLFVLPQPMFVPIPVFVRPPLYVAPPPNNIIYQNIHNTTVINTVINRPPLPPPPGVGPGPAGPGPGPGNLAPAVAGRANPVGPAVPQAVAQRAALIQQGKAPMPPSATMQPTARPGAPPVTPANVAPNAGPGAGPGAVPNTVPGAAPTAAPPTRLPQANTLPVPGAHGGPPPPAGAGTLPGGRPAPTANLPGAPPPRPGAPTTAAPGTTPPGRPGVPTAAAPATAAPTVTNPAVAPGQLPKPPVAQTPSGTAPADRARAATREPGGSTPPGAAGTPPGASGRPVTPPPSAVREQIRPQTQPSAPPQAARPVAPPPRPQAVTRPTPPPPPRVSAPPPRMAAPPPPRPAPPVAVARPAPPPMARPAPPPPVARPAPPPPPRMAVAPPPRPAPPPPRPAGPPPAAKKCPPNQPRC
ncbi:caspase family protein [Bradyrhizobium cosmicum]|uniref:caspase family protein n=1 Tax=Bradyrhizobium cosmicum TaxID=1404864 RepID=UPI00116230BF|nr:caspase family protein [Bradyrhizobium cosmicum]QDP26490.1 caspase-like domain-containing protein [Bradyrhizobium cosmicum]